MQLSNIPEYSAFTFNNADEIISRDGQSTHNAKGIWIYLTVCEGTTPNLVNTENGYCGIFKSRTFYENTTPVGNQDKYGDYARETFWHSNSPLMSFNDFSNK